MKLKLLLITAVSAIALFAVPTMASASTTCSTLHRDGMTLVIKHAGTTSCAMAYTTARQAALNGFPRAIWVRSPVTHRSYRMYRTTFYSAGDYGHVAYFGHGANGTTVQASLDFWAD